MEIKNTHIIFFDGICNLCNTLVRWLIKWDKNAIFKFASLQSEEAKRLLPMSDLSIEPSTLVYFENGNYFTKSTAVLKIMGHLPIMKFATVLRYVPKSVRDQLYDLIAKYRYRIFGKKEKCPVPNSRIKHRFL